MQRITKPLSKMSTIIVGATIPEGTFNYIPYAEELNDPAVVSWFLPFFSVVPFCSFLLQDRYGDVQLLIFRRSVWGGNLCWRPMMTQTLNSVWFPWQNHHLELGEQENCPHWCPWSTSSHHDCRSLYLMVFWREHSECRRSPKLAQRSTFLLTLTSTRNSLQKVI